MTRRLWRNQWRAWRSLYRELRRVPYRAWLALGRPRA